VAWSPDSSRVATWVDLESTIGIYGLDGKRQALLTVPQGLKLLPGDFDPEWSPDGASLLLPGGVEIPVDGSPPRQVPTDDPRSMWPFAYSGDGADVVYFSPEGLTVAAADGSRARVLVPPDHLGGSWFGPVWSPQGDRIAFEYRPAEARGTKLAVLDVTSGTVVPLVDLGAGSSSMLRFSPEGDQILFTRADAAGGTSLWSVHTDGSGPSRLVAGAGWGDWQTLTPRR
jgi:Tol biopolymer transport system component